MKIVSMQSIKKFQKASALCSYESEPLILTGAALFCSATINSLLNYFRGLEHRVRVRRRATRGGKLKEENYLYLLSSNQTTSFSFLAALEHRMISIDAEDNDDDDDDSTKEN